MFSPIHRIVAACAAAVVLLHPLAVSAAESPHVRVFDRTLRANLDSGALRSPTMAALIAQIDAAPILVFVVCGPQLSSRIGARLQLAASINGIRYIRVEMNCFLGERQLTTLLAHEFQHALEIAARSDIIDSDSMESYYEDVGFQTYFDGNHKSFETEAAMAVQRRVNAELKGKAPGGHYPASVAPAGLPPTAPETAPNMAPATAPAATGG